MSQRMTPGVLWLDCGFVLSNPLVDLSIIYNIYKTSPKPLRNQDTSRSISSFLPPWSAAEYLLYKAPPAGLASYIASIPLS